MKKSGIVLALLFSLILVSGLVAAQEIPVPATELGAPELPALTQGTFAKFVYDAISSVFNLVGEVLFNTDVGGAFYTKVLVFILIFMVLYPVAKRVKLGGDNENVNMIIALIVSVLGVRFLTDKLVNLILIPYGVLAITISSIIPLILLYTFSESALKDHKWMQKILWTLAAVSFIGLWIHRFSSVGAAANLYLITAFICLIMLIYEKKLTVHSLIYGHLSAAILNTEILISNLGKQYAEALDADDYDLADKINRRIEAKNQELEMLRNKARPSWLRPAVWGIVIILGLYIAYILQSGGLVKGLTDVFNFG